MEPQIWTPALQGSFTHRSDVICVADEAPDAGLDDAPLEPPPEPPVPEVAACCADDAPFWTPVWPALARLLCTVGFCSACSIALVNAVCSALVVVADEAPDAAVAAVPVPDDEDSAADTAPLMVVCRLDDCSAVLTSIWMAWAIALLTCDWKDGAIDAASVVVKFEDDTCCATGCNALRMAGGAVAVCTADVICADDALDTLGLDEAAAWTACTIWPCTELCCSALETAVAIACWITVSRFEAEVAELDADPTGAEDAEAGADAAIATGAILITG